MPPLELQQEPQPELAAAQRLPWWVPVHWDSVARSWDRSSNHDRSPPDHSILARLRRWHAGSKRGRGRILTIHWRRNIVEKMSMRCADHENRCRRARCTTKIQDNHAEIMHPRKVQTYRYHRRSHLRLEFGVDLSFNMAKKRDMSIGFVSAFEMKTKKQHM